MKFCMAALGLLCIIGKAFSQEAQIAIPAFDDTYSKYVKQLENGDLNVDYADFRNSFLDSKQFGQKSTNYSNLRKQLNTEIKNNNYPEVIRITRAMLSIDYTSLLAHKYLQQTYKILGDTLNYRKYHDIEFGLLNSIVKSGDGKTCQTGWHVTQIEEEYFIINMMGLTFSGQGISSGGKNTCDRMTVKTETGETKIIYFEANKIFEQERKLFGK